MFDPEHETSVPGCRADHGLTGHGVRAVRNSRNVSLSQRLAEPIAKRKHHRHPSSHGHPLAAAESLANAERMAAGRIHDGASLRWVSDRDGKRGGRQGRSALRL